MKCLMAEVNFSEGRDQGLIDQVRDAMLAGDPIDLMEISSDGDHNRTVFTFKGEPRAVLEASKRLSAKAVELIDMTKHSGAHPRIGAVDVVPFIPVKDVTIDEALEICREYGKFMGELGVPVYYYEDAATSEERKSLPKIRKGQYEGLEEKMKDPAWKPDEGPSSFNAKSGATVTGVRFPLVAFNVNLQTKDLDIGKKIVKAVRAEAVDRLRRDGQKPAAAQNVRRLRDALFILHRAEGKPFCLQCSLFFLKPRCSRAAFRPAPAS